MLRQTHVLALSQHICILTISFAHLRPLNIRISSLPAPFIMTCCKQLALPPPWYCDIWHKVTAYFQPYYLSFSRSILTLILFAFLQYMVYNWGEKRGEIDQLIALLHQLFLNFFVFCAGADMWFSKKWRLPETTGAAHMYLPEATGLSCGIHCANI